MPSTRDKKYQLLGFKYAKKVYTTADRPRFYTLVKIAAQTPDPDNFDKGIAQFASTVQGDHNAQY
jgi:hypothetical protein